MMGLRALAQSVAVAAVFGVSALGGVVWRSGSGAVTEEPFEGAHDIAHDSGVLSRGRPGAPVVHVFGDYECVACEAFERETGPVLRELADAGRIRLVIHDATLSAHNLGVIAATAVRCALPMGTGWAVHEALYRQAAEWKNAADPSAHIRRLARDASVHAGRAVPESELAACMSDESTVSMVAGAREHARRMGIGEVPMVIVNGNRLRFTSWRALAKHVTNVVAAP